MRPRPTASFPRGSERLAGLVHGRSLEFGLLVALLLLTAFLGGSSRADILGLAVLRPVAAVLAAYGLWRLRREHVERHWFLCSMAAALLALALLHVVPLPHSIWSSLPGRDIILAIDAAGGVGPVWRPLSMTPGSAWNALYSLVVPLAVLILGIQLSERDLKSLLLVMIGLGLVSALLGMLQALGDANGPLYLYRATHRGFAVGLFANRNHQALYLAAMLPMLAVWAAPRNSVRGDGNGRLFLALLIGIFLIPLLLVIGSRTGGAVAIFGLVAAPVLYGALGHIGKAKLRSRRLLVGSAIGVVAAMVLTGAALWTGRAEAIRRLMKLDLDAENRDEIWAITWEQIGRYFPWGSGAGSYERVIQIVEPDSMLRPTYSNHAHNDWLEVMLTFGVPGILLLIVSAMAVLEAARRLIQRRANLPDAAWGWMGLVVIVMAAICSITDYPLRVPLVAALFVVACLWSSFGTRTSPGMAARI